MAGPHNLREGECNMGNVVNYDVKIADEVEATKSVHHLYVAVVDAIKQVDARLDKIEEVVQKVQASRDKKGKD